MGGKCARSASVPPIQGCMPNRSLQRLLAGFLALAEAGLISTGVLQPARAQLGSKPVKVAAEGVRYAVFPVTAISGYDFTGPAQLAPYVDTIPGRATDAWARHRWCLPRCCRRD